MSRGLVQAETVLVMMLAGLMVLSSPAVVSPAVEPDPSPKKQIAHAQIETPTAVPPPLNGTGNNTTTPASEETPTVTPSPPGGLPTATQTQTHPERTRALKAVLADETRSRRAAALDAADAALATRQEMIWDGHLDASMQSKLATQRTNLRGGRALLNRTKAEADTNDNLARAGRLAVVGMKLQVAQLNPSDQPTDPTAVTLPNTQMPEHDSPSTSAFAIIDQYDVTPSAEQAANIRALDEIPEPTRSELTDVLDAYLGYFLTTQEAYADANQTRLRQLANSSTAELMTIENRTLAWDETTPASGSETSPTALEGAGVDVSRIRAAQVRLLEATVALNIALDHVDTPGIAGPASHDPVDVGMREEDVIAINLSTHNNTYEKDYALLIDRGGNDTYNNNAGGGGERGGENPGTAALIDLGGKDTYKGDEGSAGTNGGSEGGAGFLLDAGGNDTYVAGDFGTNGGSLGGVGFLLDASGSDTYTAGNQGTNGGGGIGAGFLIDAGGSDNYTAGRAATNGGAVAGIGFLLDANGTDTYTAREGATNGGGAFAGVGFLLDRSGSDAYNATNNATNGGGWTGGVGFLLDTRGSDNYTASDTGTNGGGQLGVGSLLDVSGDDTYTAGSEGVNGGGESGVGLLVDAGGTDTYADDRGAHSGESCDDCSEIPKGTVGVQADSDTLSQATPNPQVSGDRCVEGLRDSCDGDGTVGQDEDGDEDEVYGTIHSALDDAQPGETIEVRPDTYHENVTVDTPGLTLVANHSAALGDVTLDGRAGTDDPRENLVNGVKVQAAGVKLTGFIIRDYTSDEIVLSAGANQSLVRENTVHGSMAVSKANGTATHANWIDQNKSAGAGLTVTTAPYATVGNNRVTGGGITLTKSPNTTVANNTVTGRGLTLTDSPNTTVVHNTVEDISAGDDGGLVGGAGTAGTQLATAADSPHSVVDAEPVGITVTGGQNLTVADNTVRSLSEAGAQDGPVGIAVVGTTAPTVTNNSVTNLTESGTGAGPVGIVVRDGNATTVTHNSFDFLAESGEGAGPTGITVRASTLAVPVAHNEVTNIQANGEGRGPVGLLLADNTLDSPHAFSPNDLDDGGGVLIINSTLAVTETNFGVDITVVNSTVSPVTDNTFAGNLTIVNSTVSPLMNNNFTAEVRMTDIRDEFLGADDPVRIVNNRFTKTFYLSKSAGVTIANNEFNGTHLKIQATEGIAIRNNTFNGKTGAITIAAISRSTVVGNTIQGLTSAASPGRAIGIQVVNGTSTTLARNSLLRFKDKPRECRSCGTEGPVGMLVTGGTNMTLRNNSIVDVVEKYEGERAVGIRITSSFDTIVTENTLENVIAVGDGRPAIGIDLVTTDHSLVRRNTLTSVGTGFNLTATANASIRENSVTASAGGINLTASDRSHVERNKLETPDTGINLMQTTGSVVKGNTITNATTGVVVNSTTAETKSITNNRFFSIGGYGVRNEGLGSITATRNYWGAPTGPGSPDSDAHSPFADPETGIPASGQGSLVSEGPTDGVSNVHFDPWLVVPDGGGKGSTGFLAVEGPCDGVDVDGQTGLTEDGDGDRVHGTIQGAVDAAEAGSILNVADCTYTENVTITTPGLTLDGNRAAVLAGQDKRMRGFAIRADGVTVREFTVRNYTRSGITILNTDARVANTTLRQNGNGTVVYGTGSPTLEANWFHNNSFAGLTLASNATVADETVFHNRFQANDAYGVYNANATAVVNATYNHWGAFDAPSSPKRANTTLTDPKTGAQANGSGDAVSMGATSGVSNVHFSPYSLVHYRWEEVDYFVDDDGADCATDIASIQTGINKSSAGDTVVVCGGTYHENVTMGPGRMTLRGSRYAEKPNISGWVKITSARGGNRQNLRGFKISNPLPHGDGVIVKAKYLTIAENNLTGNFRGIVRQDCPRTNAQCGDNSLIVDNNFTSNEYGYHDSDKTSDYPSTLRGNKFINNSKYGIYRQGGSYGPGSHVTSTTTGATFGGIMAVNNTWECGGPSGGYRDQKTGRPANGTGDRITRKTRFDPFDTVNFTVINGEKVPCVRLDDPSVNPVSKDNHSDPTVQEFSVSEVETRDADAEFNVDWRVNDSDGDLREVELTLVDETTGGNNEQHMEKNVDGESADRVTRMVAARDDTKGHNYTVKLVVRDEAGNTSRATTTITETEPTDTPTASWPSEETETPGVDSNDGGTGPGSGSGTGPGTGGSGGTNGTSTAGSGGVSTAEATADGESRSTVQRTAERTDTRTSTASTPPPSTPTLTQTPPVTPTPEVIPGFGVGAWVFGFVLLVGLLAARRRD